MKTFEQHWDEIETWFDFQKVKKTMEFLEWSWSLSNGVPSLVEIIESAKARAKESYDSQKSSSSGGFYAEYNKKIDCLDLQFILTDWRTNDK